MPEFQEKCHHQHDVICDRCEVLDTSLAQIEVPLAQIEVPVPISSEQVQLRYAFHLF